ncbi:MAG: GGDEF domain-containing protein [Ktedonobacteraceae bacterium]|nr:GGDEF domain-containing protein [Chloroflexota bacterium]
MKTPAIPGNEKQRLATLRALQILDTPPKEVNDTFGHKQGDLLLLQVGARLRPIVFALSVSGTVARLGGDEFAVLLPTAGEQEARLAVQAIRIAFEEPFTIVDMPVRNGQSYAPIQRSQQRLSAMFRYCVLSLL